MNRKGKEYNDFCIIMGEPTIGKNVWIGYFTVIDGTGGLIIEDGVEVSSGAKIMSHSTEWRCINEKRIVNGEINKEDISYKPVIVGKYSFIGTNAVILKGVKIGHHSIIGAGSVVTRDIPPYSVAVGIPARVTGDSREFRGGN
ncbi:acyltransferase [Methanolacinia paynteri]|uniref:acyltransferase n=1 Tax=Methanolacinia paynteri TaxID=230356 RepID=UPI00064F6B8D|nr:acyltransferase [Methanolacinia paynteri]